MFKKILILILFILLVFISYFYIKKDNKSIYDNMKIKTNFIAQSSVVFLNNLALDELRNKIKLDMETEDIKAIVIKDFDLKENILVSYKDNNNNIIFSDNLPIEYESYPTIEENIIEYKTYNNTILGEIILYYDNDFIFNIRKKYAQLEFLKNEQNYLKKKKVITMCIDPYWMPFEEIKYGKHTGMTSDYAKIFEQRIGIPIKLLITTSWAETLQQTRDRKCDIIPLIKKTKERESYLNFTSSYINAPEVIATKVGIPFIDSIEKIKHKKIAIVKGYYTYNRLKKDYPNINLVEVSSINEGLRQVENGTVFAYVDNSTAVTYTIQKDFIGSVTISGKLKYNSTYSLATRNDEPLLHEIFETVILSLDETTKESIVDKWIQVNYSLKTDYTLVFKIIVIALFIISGIIYWNRKLTDLNKELGLERDKAKRLTDAKSEFLANMSHEIRTPMNGIVGMAHLALECQLDEKSKNYVQKIDMSAKSLLNILNDILDFSKIEAGKLKIEKIDFNLHEIINNVINLMQKKIEEKNLKMIIDFEEDINTIYYGDPYRISQILTNLLGNAVKFTQYGVITLSVRSKRNDAVEFSIQDTGIGLSVGQIDKLFQSFSQADSSTTRKYGGTGLGLSISKQLVELLNGKIWVQSKETEGSTFSFEINLPSKKLTSKNDISTISIMNMQKYFKNTKNLNILLVEDNTINQEIVIGLLEDTSITIDTALNGKEGLDKFLKNSSKYQLIFMDIQMPIMDGIQASQEIRKINKTIPIIALTATKIQEEIGTIEEIQINGYLEKPIDIKKLYTILYKFLNKEDENQLSQSVVKSDFPTNLQYIDTAAGLKTLNSNESLYFKVLNDFKVYYKDINFESLNEDDFRLMIHTLKGLSGNIGAKSLHKLTLKIESNPNIKCLEELTLMISNVLDEISILNFKEEKSTSKLNIIFVEKEKLFLNLKEALKIKRPKRISECMIELDKYNLEEDTEKYNMIKKAISKYKYKEALDIF